MTVETLSALLASQTKKAGLFRKLLHEILRRKASDQFDVESMALCGKLVELSPEVHTGAILLVFRYSLQGPIR